MAEMDQPPTKKRAIALITTPLDDDTPGKYSEKWTIIHQQDQLKVLQAQLDHERSAHLLDQRNASQSIEQLKQHITMAQDNSDSNRKLLQESIDQKDARLQALIEERNSAISAHRRMQLQLMESDTTSADDFEKQQQAGEIRLLQEKLQAAYDREESYTTELNDLKTTMAQQIESLSQPTLPSEATTKLLESAPPAVMMELSRSRIRCATAERRVRELERAVAAHRTTCATLTATVEKQQLQAADTPRLRGELDTMSKELAQAQAELCVWKEFQQDMSAVMGSHNNNNAKEGPPEIATMRRMLNTIREEQQQAKTQVAQFQRERDDMRAKLQGEDEKVRKMAADTRDFSSKENSYKVEIRSLQSQLAVAKQETGLFQRESESLRQLMKTFEIQMQKRGTTAASLPLNPSTETLRIQLETAQCESKKWKEMHQSVAAELLETEKTLLCKERELDTLKDENGKISAALADEREKTSVTQANVAQTDQVVSNGSPSPSSTQSLVETPAVKALKAEIAVLQRLVEALRSSRKETCVDETCTTNDIESEK